MDKFAEAAGINVHYLRKIQHNLVAATLENLADRIPQAGSPIAERYAPGKRHYRYVPCIPIDPAQSHRYLPLRRVSAAFRAPVLGLETIIAELSPLAGRVLDIMSGEVPAVSILVRDFAEEVDEQAQ
jgi:hypothetical protein